MNHAAYLSAFVLALSVAGAQALAKEGEGRFNQNGNILISDQFNNRVVEIDRNKHIVFQFGSNNPTLCNPGPGSIIAPNDVERLANDETLIVGTGASLPSFTCADNRVIIIDRFGHIVFQYGQAGVAGSGPNELNVPVFAVEDQRGNILITDQGNNRIILVDRNKKILFSYGPTSGPGALNSPNSAEILRNGNILIADELNNRVLQINRSGNIVAEIKGSFGGLNLNVVAFASRLRNGDTLVTDSGNNRVIQIDKTGKVVFEYKTNLQPGSNPSPNPTNAVRLRDGNTLIADQFNNRVLSVGSAGNIAFQYGELNKAGKGPDQLNAPYNAVVIGQYLGVTRPPGVSNSSVSN
jgi:hypothetical protein